MATAAAQTEFVEVAEGLPLSRTLYDILKKPYQVDGVIWIYELFKSNKIGAILADEMGVGKTIQVVAFISGMIKAELLNNVLIVMPNTLLETWKEELRKWSPQINVSIYEGTQGDELLDVQKNCDVLLTTNDTFKNRPEPLKKRDGRSFTWDYIIVDEAHHIKNPTAQITTAVKEIKSKYILLLTGTPIQNTLDEFHTLFDVCLKGTLLGSNKTFREEYENAIERSRVKGSLFEVQFRGLILSKQLREVIRPYFLRRSKEDAGIVVRKTDFIVWTIMSEDQMGIYKSVIESASNPENRINPLVKLNVLKNICRHPNLLTTDDLVNFGLPEELVQQRERTEFQYVTDDVLISQSGKLSFVTELIVHLKDTGHKILVFSQSLKLLNIIDRILQTRRISPIRIDGSVNVEERNRRIRFFEEYDDYSVFLLTTQVGSEGLTLTAADRVIICDPNWNPSIDTQAMNRACRIGQKKDVIIYRLVTCGTVEEIIYRRQIFKESLRLQVIEGVDLERYFSEEQLKDVYKFEDEDFLVSRTHQLLEDNLGNEIPEDLTEHARFLKSFPEVSALSDHGKVLFANQNYLTRTTESTDSNVGMDQD